MSARLRSAGEWMSQLTIGDLLSADASFTERPTAVAGDLRRGWRLSLLLLILDRCHGRSATLEQVHVIGWAVLNESGRTRLAEAVDGGAGRDVPLIRFDPAWSRVVDLAVGLDLAEWTSTGRVKLTPRARPIVDELWHTPGVLSDEREFLAGIRVSQTMIENLLRRGE